MASVAIGILSGVLSVLAGGGVTVVLPVLLALGLEAEQAKGKSRLNLTVGAIIATFVLARNKKIDWKATAPLLAATVVGTLIGTWLGTMIRSGAMLTIIVLTSVVSMILVYMKPNRWLSRESAGRVLSEHAGVVMHALPCPYGDVVAVDSALLALGVWAPSLAVP